MKSKNTGRNPPDVVANVLDRSLNFFEYLWEGYELMFFYKAGFGIK